MTPEPYTPGPPAGVDVQTDGERWPLVVTRKLSHPPSKVWRAMLSLKN